MSTNSLKEELRSISKCYYALPLLNAGFVNYRDDLLNWYKIYNGVICHFHILLSFPRRMLPIFFVWWFHPTYVPASLNLPLAWTQFDEPLQLYVTLKGSLGCAPLPGGEIPVPKLPKHGAEFIYEELFPQMEALQTREAVYENLRNRVISNWKNESCKYPLSNALTPDFADQALMMRDTELIPHCMESVEKLMIARQNCKPCYPALIWRSAELLEAQWKALQGTEVEQYLALLKERKAMFLKKYKMHDNVFEL